MIRQQQAGLCLAVAWCHNWDTTGSCYTTRSNSSHLGIPVRAFTVASFHVNCIYIYIHNVGTGIACLGCFLLLFFSSEAHWFLFTSFLTSFALFTFELKERKVNDSDPLKKWRIVTRTTTGWLVVRCLHYRMWSRDFGTKKRAGKSVDLLVRISTSA